MKNIRLKLIIVPKQMTSYWPTFGQFRCILPMIGHLYFMMSIFGTIISFQKIVTFYIKSLKPLIIERNFSLAKARSSFISTSLLATVALLNACPGNL